MQILSYMTMQHIHTLRLWTVHEVNKGRDFNEPTPTVEETTENFLTENINAAIVIFKKSYSRNYEELIKAFGNEDAIRDHILNIFKLENEGITCQEN